MPVVRSYFRPNLALTIIAIVITAAAIETDVFVPSFPAIQEYFGISESVTQMVLSVNFLGLCIAGLLYGPLSDSFGRRRILIIGMSLFLVASIGCIVAQSIESLLFWRFIQGLGSSAGFVVTGAMIFDLYSSEQAAKVLGIYNSLITISMSMAPMVGSYLTLHFSWRANFVFIGIVSLLAFLMVVFYLKESLPEGKRTAFKPSEIFKNFAKMIMHRQIVITLIIICATFAAYMIYIANLSLLFINHLNVDPHTYVYYQGAVLAVFAVVSITLPTWLERLGMNKTRMLGQILSFAAACGLMIVAIKWQTSPLLITLAMCLFTVGFALMITLVWGEYMEVFPEMKGLSSALCNFLRLLTMAAAIGVSGIFFNGTIVPVAILVLLGSGLATVAFILQKLD